MPRTRPVAKPGAKPAKAKFLKPTEGQRVLAAFGQRGAVLYAMGQSYSQIADAAIVELKANIDSAKAEMTSLKRQIAYEDGKHKNALGEGLGRFADSIKLPSRRAK